jgi:uncharacterized delta-60 repeat protein
VNETLGFKSRVPTAVLAAMTIGVLGGSIAVAQAAGTLDTTFGTGGTVTTIFTGDTITPFGAVEQPNGDIVVLSATDLNPATASYTQFALTRYTSTGVLDTTFGDKGSTFTAFTTVTFAPFALALEANGEFLVAGVATTAAGGPEFGLALFTTAGVLDTTFGTGGLAAVNLGGSRDFPSSVLLQPNGQILMGGLQLADGKDQKGMLSFARFNSNGTLDTTFGTAGVSLVTATILGPEAMAILSNGDYLAVGENSSGTGGTEVEISSTGVLESSVTGGTVTAISPLQGLEDSPTLFETNGEYVVANQTATSHDLTTHPVVSLFSEVGVQSTAFAATKIAFGGNAKNIAQAIAVQSNGQVVVGGLINNASPIFGGLARLDSNGALDTTFGNGGTVTFDNSVSAVLIEANGDIVAVEAPGANGGDGIVLQRYLAN